MEKSDRRQHINEQKKHKKFHPPKNKQTVADVGRTKKPISSSSATTTKGNTINLSSIPNKNISGDGETENDNENDESNSSQQWKQFSKRGVQSNWEKYEETSDDHEENEQSLAADFQSLLIAPQSVGSYFVFNTEKDWEILTGDDSGATSINSAAGGSGPDPNQYFHLNLIQLAESLQCIPFYERQNLPIDLFTNDEQHEMIKEANRFKQKFKKNNRISKQMNETTTTSVVNTNLEQISQSNKNTEDEVDDELDALLSFNVKPQKPDKDDKRSASLLGSVNREDQLKSSNKVNKQQQSKQELQQWLDDILDE